MTKKEWFLMLGTATLVGMLLYKFICQDVVKCGMQGGMIVHTANGHECVSTKRLQ